MEGCDARARLVVEKRHEQRGRSNTYVLILEVRQRRFRGQHDNCSEGEPHNPQVYHGDLLSYCFFFDICQRLQRLVSLSLGFRRTMSAFTFRQRSFPISEKPAFFTLHVICLNHFH